MKEAFTDWSPRPASVGMLNLVNGVITDYQAQGYQLTLRQLYYQLVARDLIPNSDREYKKLANLLTKARMAGLVDWDAIVDRGRSPVKAAEWPSPASILESAAYSYRLDRWEGQEYHVEVWCEKDALSSVLEPVCNLYHVIYMANKGYSSATAMYDAAKRIDNAHLGGLQPVIIYLGDHDPSGLDMTRDIDDRLYAMSYQTGAEVRRIALNFDQVEEHQPPPNPTKLTDSRSSGYIAEHGNDSWELDALDPTTLDELVTDAIMEYLDLDKYEERVALEDVQKEQIRKLARTFSEE